MFWIFFFVNFFREKKKKLTKMLRTTFTTLKRSTQIIQRPLSLSGTRLYHEKVFKKNTILLYHVN